MKKHLGVISNIKFMGRTNGLLCAVLGAQIVLAGGLYWQSRGEGNFAPAQNLALFEIDAVDSLVISDGASELTLVRVDDGWQVNGDPAVPADAQAVAGVLDSLHNMEAGLPVATSEASQAQLEVADDNYQRRLTVKSGDEQLAQLYLGTSPGFRKAHVRLDGQQAIHAARVNVFDFQTTENDWLDKQLLAFDDVSEVSSQAFTLRKESNTWRIAQPEGMQQSHVINAAIADEMIGSLEQLRVTGVHSPAAQTTVESDEESVELSFTVPVDGEPVVLSIVKQGDVAYAERDDMQGRFSISSGVFDTFAAYTADSLILEENEASVN